MDNARERFNVWSPPDSRWAVWGKPALFTVFTQPGDVPMNLPDLSSWQVAVGDTAVIVNLPGAESVIRGLALAKRGYRPVSLFNTIDGPSAYLDVMPIAAALANGTSILQQMALAPDAPPAFLMDSMRYGGNPAPGQFDNRWAVFPQDFPSGVFLLSCGIKRVIVVQLSNTVQLDLAPILGLWQQAGVEIMSTTGAPLEPEQPMSIAPVSAFNIARTIYISQLISSIGLRRGMTGGFGAIYPTSGGG
jgi:hypothetical protein